MVGKGTYAEFLRSGIDFASLLKKDEEVVEQLSVPGTPNLKSARNRTFSESSVLSQDSSSQKDGAVEQPPVSAEDRSVLIFVWLVFNLNFDMGFPCSIEISGITWNCIIRWELTCGGPAQLCLAGSSQLSVVLFKPSRVSVCTWASALLGAGDIACTCPHCASFSLSSDSSALKDQSHCGGCVHCVCAVLNWSEHFPWNPELWEVHVEAVALCKVCVCMAGINTPINIPTNIPTWSWAGPAGVILGHHCLLSSALLLVKTEGFVWCQCDFQVPPYLLACPVQKQP